MTRWIRSAGFAAAAILLPVLASGARPIPPTPATVPTATIKAATIFDHGNRYHFIVQMSCLGFDPNLYDLNCNFLGKSTLVSTDRIYKHQDPAFPDTWTFNVRSARTTRVAPAAKGRLLPPDAGTAALSVTISDGSTTTTSGPATVEPATVPST